SAEGLNLHENERSVQMWIGLSVTGVCLILISVTVAIFVIRRRRNRRPQRWSEI
ncbi:hypothetical protein BgiBS90_019224, partial [Biomphalaria glabrata]